MSFIDFHGFFIDFINFHWFFIDFINFHCFSLIFNDVSLIFYSHAACCLELGALYFYTATPPSLLPASSMEPMGEPHSCGCAPGGPVPLWSLWSLWEPHVWEASPVPGSGNNGNIFSFIFFLVKSYFLIYFFCSFCVFCNFCF